MDCSKEHMRTDREKEEDRKRQMKELWELRRAVKTFLVVNKIKNVVMVDPLAALGVGSDMVKAREIMADNFHLTKE